MLEIERIITGGDGIGRHGDGRVVFVRRTAPGDRVEVEYTEEHRQWFRARLVRVLEPSPSRRVPPCPHYDACGGCQLQHLAYGAQLTAKAAVVVDSLRRLGHLEVESPEVVPSPREFGYRNRITLVLRRYGDGAVVGYHGFDDPLRVVAVDCCPLAEQPINDVWSAVSLLLEQLGGGLSARAEWRLTFRVSSAREVGLAIEGVNRPGDIERSVSESLVDQGLSALWMVNREGRIIAHAGAETLVERWGDYDIPLAGTAFVQVNREVAALLDAHVLDQCRVTAETRVIEGYCGFGLRALELSRRGADVVGIDSDRHAIRGASALGASRNLPARFVAERFEQVLSRELPADTVILNPPRSGVTPAVVKALLRSPAGRVVYISCNPATLARDLKHLGQAFALESCRAFDLFPQTAHVETVVTLVRRAG